MRFARMAVEEHKVLGTPRDRSEPATLRQNYHLAGRFIADGERAFANRPTLAKIAKVSNWEVNYGPLAPQNDYVRPGQGGKSNS